MDYSFLENRLPKLPCLCCGSCCNMVPCSEEEFQAILDYASEHDIMPLSQGTRCPWVSLSGPCQIYEVRPFVCRLQGHVPGTECGQGIMPTLSAEFGQDMVNKYYQMVGESKIRWLHEVLPEQVEAVANAMSYYPLRTWSEMAKMS